MASKIRKRRIGPPLDAAEHSKFLLVKIAPDLVGMFRFLLEAYGHVAYFSVINKYDALLKIVFSPHRERAAHAALQEISQSLDITILPFPTSNYKQD